MSFLKLMPIGELRQDFIVPGGFREAHGQFDGRIQAKLETCRTYRSWGTSECLRWSWCCRKGGGVVGLDAMGQTPVDDIAHGDHVQVKIQGQGIFQTQVEVVDRGFALILMQVDQRDGRRGKAAGFPEASLRRQRKKRRGRACGGRVPGEIGGEFFEGQFRSGVDLQVELIDFLDAIGDVVRDGEFERLRSVSRNLRRMPLRVTLLRLGCM